MKRGAGGLQWHHDTANRWNARAEIKDEAIEYEISAIRSGKAYMVMAKHISPGGSTTTYGVGGHFASLHSAKRAAGYDLRQLQRHRHSAYASREDRPMSKAMTKHGHGKSKEMTYGESMENGPKTTGFLWALGFAALGAIIGGVRGTSGAKGTAALMGAEQGLGLVTLGGTVVGFLSEGARNPALATAGIGLIGITGLGIVSYLVTPSTAATTTTTTTS